MKKYALLLLLLSFSFTACRETTEPVETTIMLVSKGKITLDPMRHMDSSIVALLCGCRFTLSVENFAGDTSVIHYAQRDATNGAYRVAIDVSADTIATSGSYTAKLAILSSGAKGTYRDTIDVTYVK